jgi:hypothetical protein
MERLRGEMTHTTGFTGTCASDPCQSGQICNDYQYNGEDRHSCDSCTFGSSSLPYNATTRQAISVFFFTDSCARKAVIDSSAPIDYILWDALGAKNAYSQDDAFCAASVDVYIEDWAGKNHSKVGVFDNTLFIGSMNWSNNGDANNDEQTLIIHDATLATQVFNEIKADVESLSVTACTQASAEVCDDGSDNDYNGLKDYCDYQCNCTNPAADCLSCLDAPSTGGNEVPGCGGGVVDCDLTPTDPACTGSCSGGEPSGYSCDTVCVDSRDGSCYCTSTDSTDACYDSGCDPGKTALDCTDNQDGTYTCDSAGPVSSSDLRISAVTMQKVKGQVSEVRTNTKWYAFDESGLVYEEYWCESPHPYDNDCGYGVSGCSNDASYWCNAYRSNASKIAVWFAGVDTQACLCKNGSCNPSGTVTCCIDCIDLKDSSMTHVAYYGGPVDSGYYGYGWSSWVTGTTANLFLDTSSSGTDWGMAISAVVYEPPSGTATGEPAEGGGGGTVGESCETDNDCETGLTCQKVKGQQTCM